jgi:hypothetical protein
MDSVDDLGTVDALEVNAGDGEVGVSELPLDDDEWNAFVCHLDRMSVSKLVRGEAPASSCRRSGVMELLSGCGGLPVPSGRWTVDHAQQRSDRQLPPPLLPGFELGPGHLSMPTSRRFPPLPWRTRIAPRVASRSLS